jgi:hypothetical protein
MAIQIDATQPRDFGGRSARQIVEGFVSIQTAGAREIAKELELMALRAQRDPGQLRAKAVKRASEILVKGYRSKINNVTDNLSKSIATRIRQYDGATVAVTGPRVTGPVGADPDMGSGNHAWLVEFGTGPRRPGTQGRRTYINVHQMINGKMNRAGTFNDKQFASMSRGYYFLMGSKNERTRQAKAGSGGDHDFWTPKGGGKQRPVTLHPGETYRPMPAKHPMERTISENSSAVLAALIANMRNYIEELQ